MRLRRMYLRERIFHNEKEDYELEMYIHGTKEELKQLQIQITELVNTEEKIK